MRTLWITLPLLSLLGCSPVYKPSNALDQAFYDASEEFGVPRDVLVALAWANTRLHSDVTGLEGDAGPTVGIMGLRDGMSPDLQEGSLIADVNPNVVYEQEEQNIRVAAAWLAARAQEREWEIQERIDTLEEWYPVVAEYSGASDASVAEGFAAQVFDAIEFGIFGYREETDEYIEVTPRELLWRNSRTRIAGSALVDQFIAASTNNYSNYSRTGSDIDYIIVHVTQGSYSGTISWFQNSSAKVSAHYVIRSSDGQITQMVDEADVAWHAGNWEYNEHSIGLEHEGWIEHPDDWFTDAMYRQSAALVADICDRNGIPKDRSHILGHDEVPGATHTDPGSGWDWDLYMDYILGGTTSHSPVAVSEGPRSGTFSATVSASRYGVTDTCSGPISGQVAGGQVYLTGECTLDNHEDKVSDLKITWNGSVVGDSIEGRIAVDSYTDPWTGTLDASGAITGTMSGSKDLGGDVGVVTYSATLNANPS